MLSHPRIFHPYIDRSIPAVSVQHPHQLPFGSLGHIVLDEKCVRPQFLGERLARFGVEVGEDHLRSFLHENARMRRPHALCGASNDRNLVF